MGIQGFGVLDDGLVKNWIIIDINTIIISNSADCVGTLGQLGAGLIVLVVSRGLVMMSS